jgi:hypothetical protein
MVCITPILFRSLRKNLILEKPHTGVISIVTAIYADAPAVSFSYLFDNFRVIGLPIIVVIQVFG